MQRLIVCVKKNALISFIFDQTTTTKPIVYNSKTAVILPTVIPLSFEPLSTKTAAYSTAPLFG